MHTNSLTNSAHRLTVAGRYSYLPSENNKTRPTIKDTIHHKKPKFKAHAWFNNYLTGLFVLCQSIELHRDP